MKYFLIILLAFTISSTSNAQNFKRENGKIIWQKVFETELTKNEIIKSILNSGRLKFVDSTETQISVEFENIDPDYKMAGYKLLTTPIYLRDGFVSGFAVIEFKELKYRITIRNIKITQKYDTALSKMGEETNIETYALDNRGNYKSAFTNSPKVILYTTFTNMFTFYKTENSDDW